MKYVFLIKVSMILKKEGYNNSWLEIINDDNIIESIFTDNPCIAMAIDTYADAEEIINQLTDLVGYNSTMMFQIEKYYVKS